MADIRNLRKWLESPGPPIKPPKGPAFKEFWAFRKWVETLHPTTITAKNLNILNFRDHPMYEQWISEGKPIAPVSAVTAPTTIPTTAPEVDPVDYVAWRQMKWWEKVNAGELDASAIPQLTADLTNRIDTKGFNKFYEGYAEARDYINDIRGRGEDWVGNWQGSGRGAVVDASGNLVQLYGETPFPEDKLTAYQEAQLRLSKEELAQQGKYQQGQQNLSQLQYAAQLAAMGEEGEIERWYAQQAQQAQFEADKEKREFTPEFKAISQAMGYPEKQYPNVLWAYTAKHAPEIWGNRGGFAEDYMSSGLVEKLGNIGINITGEETYPGTTRVMDVKLQPGWASQNLWGGKARPTGYTAGGGTELTLEPKTMGRFPRQWTRPQGQALPLVSEQYGEAKEEFTTKAKGKHKARPRPKAPPTPAWLPQFAPWTTTGQPMTRGQMPTPSGQLWGQTNPAVQAGLKGFLNWQGGGRSMADILGHMALMQPETPAGIWGRRWSPARQYV